MKINEIITEDVSAEEQLSGEKLNTSLMSVLMFLSKRSEDKNLSPSMRTDSLIQLVNNAGDTTFDYNALVDAFESDEAVKSLVKTFNKDTIQLKSDSDISDSEHTSGDDNEPYAQPQDPEETVKQMAKRSSSKRQ